MGLAQRVVTFSIAVPLVMASVQDDRGFLALILVFTLLGVSEAIALVRALSSEVDRKFRSPGQGDIHSAWRRLQACVYVGSLAIVVAARGNSLELFVVVLSLTCIVVFGSHMLYFNAYTCNNIASIFRCFTDVGVLVYAAVPMALAVRLRTHYPDGAQLIWVLMAVNWNIDNGGLFFGKAIGRHKLIPKVSPGKTVEGSIGGLLFAVGTGLAMKHAIPPTYFSWPQALSSDAATIGLCVLLTVANNMGDLFESYLKRSANTKDSGGLFPGHGGVLDKIDGLLFGAPVAVAFIDVMSIMQ